MQKLDENEPLLFELKTFFLYVDHLLKPNLRVKYGSVLWFIMSDFSF